MTVHHEKMPVIDDRADSEEPLGSSDRRELPDALIDELLAGARTPLEITGEGGLPAA